MLCNKKKEISFSLDDPETVYTVQMRPVQHVILDYYETGLLVEIDGVPASIWLRSWPMERRIKTYLAGKKLESLPVDLRAELLEIAWRPMLSIIMFHTNARVRVLNFLKLKPSSVNKFSLNITLRDNKTQQESNMVMLMHDRLLPVMQRVIGYWPSHQNQSFWYQQQTRLWLQAGTLELSLQELATLEPADILMMEHQGADHRLYLRVSIHHYFQVSEEAGQLTIESGIQTMSDENANGNDEVIAALEEVPVRLTFDLGELVLPFSEVRSLTQGYTIDLNVPVSQAVTIRSMNKIIGTGELVNIDGHMGVRIIKLLARQAPQVSSVENTDG